MNSASISPSACSRSASMASRIRLTASVTRVEVGRGRAGHVHDRVELRQCAVARGLDAVEQGLDIDLVQLEGLREAGQRRGQGRGARKVPFEVRVEQQARFERQDPLLGRRKDGGAQASGPHRSPDA